MSDITAKEVYAFMLRMVKPFPWSIAIMLFAGLMWAIDISFRPYIIKILLNRITDASADEIFDLVKFPVLSYFAVSFLVATSFRMYNYFVDFKMFPKVRERIIDACFDNLLNQSHQYFQNNIPGSIATKIKNLTDRIPDIVRIVVDRFIAHTLTLSIAVYTLYQVHISFAITMSVWMGVFTIMTLLVSKRVAYHAYIWSESRVTITGKIVDVLSNILSVRLFARKAYENSLLHKESIESTEAERRLQKFYFFIWLSYSYSFLAVQALNVYFLIKGKQQGIITVGDFALVMGINISIGDFLASLTREFSEFSKIMGEINEGLKTILNPPEIQDNSDSKTLTLTTGKIEFSKVHFHYKGSTPLFENQSVIIQPKQKVGLVGYSGSGKTSFVNLILRIYNINNGQILIDNQDISEVSQESLRENIGMIPQDSALFSRTLMDNIRYARLDATDEEVIEAAKKAHAHEFISVLPNGYNSLIGENGIRLSGGQRQRIGIARAFLKNAPILILDEATSQLDSVIETLIQSALEELMQEKTTLVVAHRLSTLLSMDRILVFDKGIIIEDGSHQELLAKGGLYKKLWDAQVGGFLPEKRYEKISA